VFAAEIEFAHPTRNRQAGSADFLCSSGRQLSEMDQLWNNGVATHGNRARTARPGKPLEQAKSFAIRCLRLQFGQHGKEGVDGSSPSEGFCKVAARRPIPHSERLALRRTCGGYGAVYGAVFRAPDSRERTEAGSFTTGPRSRSKPTSATGTQSTWTTNPSACGRSQSQKSWLKEDVEWQLAEWRSKQADETQRAGLAARIRRPGEAPSGTSVRVPEIRFACP
jgi:hypothetical protein